MIMVITTCFLETYWYYWVICRLVMEAIGIANTIGKQRRSTVLRFQVGFAKYGEDAAFVPSANILIVAI